MTFSFDITAFLALKFPYQTALILLIHILEEALPFFLKKESCFSHYLTCV